MNFLFFCAKPSYSLLFLQQYCSSRKNRYFFHSLMLIKSHRLYFATKTTVLSYFNSQAFQCPDYPSNPSLPSEASFLNLITGSMHETLEYKTAHFSDCSPNPSFSSARITFADTQPTEPPLVHRPAELKQHYSLPMLYYP